MPSQTETRGDLVAAVDLGSNSFHMVIARQTGHDLQILDRIREPVRLSAGIDRDGRLTAQAQQRALACLERFGQRLSGIPADRVRAVGTNALRRATGSPGFRSAARRALHHPIEVISGMEEARLIFLGVAQSTPALDEERLVVDIGGGSTEIIHGRGFEADYAASRFMGCVSFSQRYFPDGRIDRDSFRAAQTAASQELQDVRQRLRRVAPDRVLGASGTIVSVSTLLRELDFSDGRIDYKGLKSLRRLMTDDPSGSWFDSETVRPDRLAVLPGGLSILMAVHRSLGIEEMYPSTGALREGVLYDQLGRIQHEDVRSRTINRMVERFAVDSGQAVRVSKSAAALLDQCASAWDLDAEDAGRVLGWAAQLHEVGLSVSHTGYHRHGAYLVGNSDMPGFSLDDQILLAAIIRTHRRKIRLEYFGGLADRRLDYAIRLAAIFRLAVLLNRSRVEPPSPRLSVSANGHKLQLHFAEGWLEEHPLTDADLCGEADQLHEVDLRLHYGPGA
jgi:exopolyphosphatase/guanosine-5'-triphosphate,3'-diphosphate pyrophosphatase